MSDWDAPAGQADEYRAYAGPTRGGRTPALRLLYADGSCEAPEYAYLVRTSINAEKTRITMRFSAEAWIIYGRNLGSLFEKLIDRSVENVRQFPDGSDQLPADGVVVERFELIAPDQLAATARASAG